MVFALAHGQISSLPDYVFAFSFVQSPIRMAPEISRRFQPHEGGKMVVGEWICAHLYSANTLCARKALEKHNDILGTLELAVSRWPVWRDFA